MNRRLIEAGLPFDAINVLSRREKDASHKSHPDRLHRWWARRPLAMCRALVFGALVAAPDDERERERLLSALVDATAFHASSDEAALRPLRDAVRREFGDEPPRVLDCFAGGGAIPLEALRLGCHVFASDLNPVASLIERATVEYPQRFADLASDVEHWGRWARDEAVAALADLYAGPGQRGESIIYFWARTMACQNPQCGREFPLLKSWQLDTRSDKVWLEPLVSDRVVSAKLVLGPATSAPPSGGTSSGSSATCPACLSTTPAKDVRQYGCENGFGETMLAILEGRGRARHFRAPAEEDAKSYAAADSVISGLIEYPDGSTALPDEALDTAQYRKFGMLPFGLTTFRALFNNRQLAVAAVLSQSVRRAHDEMVRAGMSAERATAVATYLAFVIDRVVDYNSSFSSWHLSRRTVRNTHGGPSIPMVWDYVEINPFAKAPGNWEGGLEVVTRAIRHCATAASNPATVLRADAQNLTAFADGEIDAVIVDPPYYDSYQYADLSDYFYVWLKRSVGHLYPELLAAPLTPKAQEIIENRADPKSAAHISSREFERRLHTALAELRRVVKDEGVVAIVFAHTESDAWERLLRALLRAGLVVSSSWPMDSEMGSRSTANVSAVLGSSVVLICRPRLAVESAFYDDVVRELDSRIAVRLDEFESLGLRGADYLVSAIGPALEVFGKYTRVERLDGQEVSVGDLLALARRTVARQAMRRLLGSEALVAVDDVSLFYLTWRWAYGAARIPVDEAQKLGKAFNVEPNELNGVDGVVETGRESYALRGPDDRKRVKLAVVPTLIDVLHVSCKLFEQGRRNELAELLSASGYAEEPALWATARAIAESLPDGNRERTLLINLLGAQAQTVEAARQARPSEVLQLFEATP